MQVPQKGDITEAKQLIGRNVVTSFTALSEAFFTKLEGVAPGTKLQTKIKYVGGSVEAACALGVADGIVDLVGTYIECSNYRLNGLYMSSILLTPSSLSQNPARP